MTAAVHQRNMDPILSLPPLNSRVCGVLWATILTPDLSTESATP